MTLIASLMCMDGLIMAADTEEVITEPPLLRSHREKLRSLLPPPTDSWRVVIGGAGEYDYIAMIGDFIQEKLFRTPGAQHSDITKAIRESVAEVWRDYARYEQRTINVNLLIGSSVGSGAFPHLTVVSGAAIREGTDLEAIGIGDATFRAQADRFLTYGQLRHVSAWASAARIFTIYAMQQAKLSIPGVGGNTRVLTLGNDGNVHYVKSWSVQAIQGFFADFDQEIRLTIQALVNRPDENAKGDNVERIIRSISSTMLQRYQKLKKELGKIEADETLV